MRIPVVPSNSVGPVRWKTRITLAVGLLAVTALSAGTTAFMLLRSRLVTAPSLLGARPIEASATADRLGLRLIVANRKHDPAVPEGRICSQKPAPGSSIKNSRALRVSVSLGPPKVRVPDVAGRSLREARLLLEPAGLGALRVVTTEHVTPAETVILQDPVAGEMPAANSQGVTLLVSRGPASADYIMPDLISRPAKATLEVLQHAGLRIADVTYRVYPGAPEGIILKQSPEAGFRVTPRTIVTVEVSGASS